VFEIKPKKTKNKGEDKISFAKAKHSV